MSYFIIMKTDWVFSAREFSRQLIACWPAARVREVQSIIKYSNFLEFEFAIDRSTLYGSLNRECNAVIFHARLQDCARFTHWCRSLIPPGERVIFCDESMSINFVLGPNMTPVEIIHAMRASER